MPDSFNLQTLFRSPLVTVSDIRCRPGCAHRGEEEQASTHGLVFPRTGIFVRHSSTRNEVVADPSRVLFFNRDETYRVSHPVPGGDDCTTLSFAEDALVDFLRTVEPSVADSPGRPFRLSATESSSSMVMRLHRLRQYLRTDPDPDPLAAEGMCASLLTESVLRESRLRSRPAQPIRSATRRAHRDLVAAAQFTLARKLSEKTTLIELARAVFSSPFHLARIFHRETGISLHRHQTRLRLRLALEHLVDGTTDLTMLGLELGFSSHAHFTHAFSREFGCTPSEFRRGRFRQLSRSKDDLTRCSR